jgi:large subunit ribosomal protein L5
MTTAERVAPRLKQRYRDEIRDGLQEQFGYGNVMQIPASSRSSSTWASATPPATRS